jgi:hypothetical protein
VRSFKFILKVGVEESIVDALRITDLTLLHEWCVHNRLFNASFEDKFKSTHDTTQTICIQGVSAKNFEPNISVICQRIFIKFKMQIF